MPVKRCVDQGVYAVGSASRKRSNSMSRFMVWWLRSMHL